MEEGVATEQPSFDAKEFEAGASLVAVHDNPALGSNDLCWKPVVGELAFAEVGGEVEVHVLLPRHLPGEKFQVQHALRGESLPLPIHELLVELDRECRMKLFVDRQVVGLDVQFAGLRFAAGLPIQAEAPAQLDSDRKRHSEIPAPLQIEGNHVGHDVNSAKHACHTVGKLAPSCRDTPRVDFRVEAELLLATRLFETEEQVNATFRLELIPNRLFLLQQICLSDDRCNGLAQSSTQR